MDLGGEMNLDKNDIERLKEVGVDEDLQKAGEFIQIDHSPFSCNILQEGVILLPLSEAIKKYKWVKDYVNEDDVEGYFLWVKKGVKVKKPFQTCAFMKEENVQNIFNLIILEEESEINLLSSCTISSFVDSALHIGKSKYVIKKNAKLTYTMIHMWGENVEVYPKTFVEVEEGGEFVSTYVNLYKVKRIISNPICKLQQNAKASFNSIIVSYPSSYIEMGGEVYLEGENSRADIVSRNVIYGGENIAKGRIIAKNKEVSGHIECESLLLSDEAHMSTIPILESFNKDVRLTHEAAVGKIAKEEIEYLMSKGIDEDSAISLIVKGFLKLEIEGISEDLKEKIQNAINLSKLGF
ncbi:hypothetical protein CMTB2_04947 [Caminibacter mediatlanticus TB-2]|uniref:SUF system FeS cluster assembly SufBD core domain-containing protein n=2 Tax=Caminibacter mediatlanticus TaxID=291048 RepID=A0AAI9AHJ1_9BACT|nr:hypothetical protein CMTB2_04947 [Caminibacter mediatlanticus TB-2]